MKYYAFRPEESGCKLVVLIPDKEWEAEANLLGSLVQAMDVIRLGNLTLKSKVKVFRYDITSCPDQCLPYAWGEEGWITECDWLMLDSAVFGLRCCFLVSQDLCVNAYSLMIHVPEKGEVASDNGWTEPWYIPF